MKFVFTGLVALAVGIGVGALAFRSEAVRDDVRPPRDGVVSEPPRVPVDVELADARVASPAAAEPDARTSVASDVDADEALLSAALLAYARDGITSGWSARRDDAIPPSALDAGMARFEELVLEAPRTIGMELAEQRTRTELAEADARRGGAFALLELLMSGDGAPVLGLVEDVTAFDALFVRESPETTVDPARAKSGDPTEFEPGSTIRFPAGCFSIGNVLERGARATAAPDLTLAGSGMDATLLVLEEDLGSRGPIRRFEIRDCTIYTNDNYLFDHRQGPATVVLTRVRVVGFDKGSGASCALAMREGVVLQAVGCRFEGGYGGMPTAGTLFDIRNDGLVARFDDCVVARTAVDLRRLQPNVTLLFSGCRLEGLLYADGFDQQLVAHPGVALAGTTVEPYDPNLHGPLVRDLNELFPGWKGRLE
ncbi:MAG: hypothetical protein R3F34_17415 [Planctomycetota bacterium]